jgi:hypothetical protein
MDINNLTNASSQLIDQSTKKIIDSAKKILNGDINPADTARSHVEALRETQIAVKMTRVSQEIGDEIIERLADTDSRKGRASDHFS